MYMCSTVAFIPHSESKSVKDDATLESLSIKDGGALFFKDLGPQLGWRTVR